jgi:hypothetical protein
MLLKQLLTMLKAEKGRQRREQFKKEPAKSMNNYQNFWANVSNVRIEASADPKVVEAVVLGLKKVVA